jgi:putative ABC transport system permease protein
MNVARDFLLAWRVLADRPARLGLSVLGVAFTVAVMFSQLAFRNGIADSAALLPGVLDCDLVVSHAQKVHLRIGDSFPLAWLHRVRAVPGVAEAVPLYTAGRTWAHPEEGYLNQVLLLGVDPQRPLLRFAELRERGEALRVPGTLLFDRLARPQLGQPGPGTESRIEGRPVKVIGHISLGSNFTYGGHAVVGADTFFELAGQSPDHVDLGLVRLAPGADRDAVRARILALPGTRMLALTPGELSSREISAMTYGTPVGLVFNLGLAIGCLIGIAVCYQILFNEIGDLLPQFALLHALGHAPARLAAVVLCQALVLTSLGFVAGLAATAGLHRYLHAASGLPMAFDAGRIGLIFACSVAMGLVAGLLALRRLRFADPAELF